MSFLFLFYLVLGIILLVLSVLAVLEKRRCTDGCVMLPARIIACSRPAPTVGKKHPKGSFMYQVEYHAEGVRHQPFTNDSFFFDHSKHIGETVIIFHKPGTTPQLVERRSTETEIWSVLSFVFGVLFVLLGLGVI